MKRIYLVLILIFSFALYSAPAYAVYLGSPNNQISHLEQIADQIDQYTKQGLQYITQGEQLAAETKMLATNPATVATSAAYNIQAISQLAGQVQQLEATAQQAAQNFQAIEGNNANPSQSYQNLSTMQGNLVSEINSLLQGYGLQAASSPNLQSNLQNDLTNLQNAQGQTEAMQASGSIAGIEVQQLQELNSNLTAEHTFELNQIQTEQAEMKQQNSQEQFPAPPAPPANLDIYGGN